ncbi:Zn-ribbon domain-containing OB-fold protein [Microbacterium aurantiacum]|uniref:Zn-ribbon domain-containing OB-fold protein n=1 Tax=Microbacterium aurantiacum TaxID=162393 RepID=A0ABT8FVQ2_9MICO|nr:Zn-ribbon domain-containing OB-fold protein [Microbacterium aurantiacum]MDN4465392.1 Zn-ribbon domain-containing OB-fold protein [Microbacterium aurantiacum]
MSTRSDLPVVESDSRPFWDGVRDAGVFRIVRCRACDQVHHYPRPFCPQCWSDDVEWVDASGAATLYTYSTVYMNDLPPFRDELPYVAAVVELAEGPRVMTRLIDCTPDELRIGMPLTMTTRALTDDITVPLFAPVR